jgi:hypothetical protein
MGAKFGAENGFTMVPKSVDTLEEGVFISLEGRFREEPVE